MSQVLSDAEINAALKDCADEPVHIPGIIQPYACLMAVTEGTDDIVCISENASQFLGMSAQQATGTGARDLLGNDAWHGVCNALARREIADQGIAAGSYDINGTKQELRVSKSAGRNIIEIEPAKDSGLGGPESLKTLSYLMAQIQACDTEQRLFDLTVNLMQLLTGFDRTLIYRFDREFNGEILAEAKQSSMDSFLGLRFPHWDIPEQARAIMAKLPLRFICDVDQTPVPMMAVNGELPLDMSLAHARGVSQVHMEYLRNMGSAATMTLSVMVDDKLWGIISFHHRRPKVPAPALRDILNNFLLVFSSKLMALRQQNALRKIEALDSVFVAKSVAEQSVEKTIPSAAPAVLDVLSAHGIASLSKDEVVVSGAVPDEEVLVELAKLADGPSQVVAIDALAEKFPELAGKFGTSAGALIIGGMPNRTICIFREEIVRDVAWAGNPEKEIEKVGDRLRLSPRGSFATFLEQVRNRCEPWSDNDIYLIQHLRTALFAAERQAMLDRLNRQQELMIGELNHRVRNILALVRSVSRQARRRYGSLDSYANAIENRIRALASAHDLSSGSFAAPISMRSLIDMEFEPFRTISDEQANIQGEDWPMKPQVAPIFSLIIHELVTNAAKYGALSSPTGRVNVSIARKGDACSVLWQETGGPTVQRPNELGFGMAMIERAVPHELGGTAAVHFDSAGLQAEFTLPLQHFAKSDSSLATVATRPMQTEVILQLPESLRGGAALVLEDNFIIAAEMSDQLRDMGFADVHISATTSDALESLKTDRPSLAVLDVNLGDGQTSEPLALQLTELDVPIVFVTGYGEDITMRAELADVPRLTKPISIAEFLEAVTKFFQP